MYFVKVYVTYKESILDPKGEAVKEAVHRLGFTEVAETVSVSILKCTSSRQKQLKRKLNKFVINY